mmetsp:Transcript_32178/g.51179  ORF Transcript_32178/g.51179 Transcript_32178/m.51179 type:complete len:203 (+) Transcript_32178:1269-1877(+)
MEIESGHTHPRGKSYQFLAPNCQNYVAPIQDTVRQDHHALQQSASSRSHRTFYAKLLLLPNSGKAKLLASHHWWLLQKAHTFQTKCRAIFGAPAYHWPLGLHTQSLDLAGFSSKYTSFSPKMILENHSHLSTTRSSILKDLPSVARAKLRVKQRWNDPALILLLDRTQGFVQPNTIDLCVHSALLYFVILYSIHHHQGAQPL